MDALKPELKEIADQFCELYLYIENRVFETHEITNQNELDRKSALIFEAASRLMHMGDHQ